VCWRSTSIHTIDVAVSHANTQHTHTHTDYSMAAARSSTDCTNLDEARRRMRTSARGSSRVVSQQFPTATVAEQQANDAESLRAALFPGRPVALTLIDSGLACTADDDPHRLFQLLRRRKRAPLPGPSKAASTSPEQGVKNEEAPQSPVLPNPPNEATPRQAAPRPANSARPVSPTKRPPTVRDAHSANLSANNGRPCTRQKLPKHALDLFPGMSAPPPTDPFPIRPRRSSVPVPKTEAAASVNFGCLFVKGNDLDSDEEFPAPKAQVEIPLIETDWFTTDTWEAVPPVMSRSSPQSSKTASTHDDEMTQSLLLYELLVAQKSASKLQQPSVKR
jgi:hypothetical protein